MLKIDSKSLIAGAAASLIAMAVWELFGRDFVNRVRDGSSSGEAGETA